MDLLLKNVTIVDSKSSLNFQKRDILIVNGIIKKISKKSKSMISIQLRKKIYTYLTDGLIQVFVSENLAMKKEKP